MTTLLAQTPPATGQTGLITWYLTIVIITLTTFLIYLVLYTTSKPMKDLHHTSLVEHPTPYGPLHDLATSFHSMNTPYEDAEQTRALIRHLFYEKITHTRHLTTDQRQQLYQNNTALLTSLIKDPELVAWLSKPPHDPHPGLLAMLTGRQAHADPHIPLSRILDKMEAWT
jgi:hypothetical protein